jgi:ATP-dependent helicase/nuclease subunit A
VEVNSRYSSDRENLFQFNENICFSAGAGSGKTSVLVKMYLALISGDSSFNEPIPLEQIVAITFTEKAAAEMKKRVREAIELKLLESEEKTLWEERLRGLERAHISTIHSFCAGILRENPVEAAIDPAFTILDDREASEVLEQIVHEVVIEGLSDKDLMISELIHDYGFSGYNQVSGLKDFLKRVCIEVYGSGLSWDKIDQMKENNYQRAEELLYSKIFSIGKNLEKLTKLIKQGAIKKSTKSFSYIEELIRKYQMVMNAKEDSLIERSGALLALDNYVKGNWPALARDLKKELKDSFSEMEGAYYQLLCNKYLNGFQQLLKKISQRYQDWKLDHGVFDFDDLQIKARDILRTNRGIRRELKSRFKVIMLDEFQDTNSIQKEIVCYLCENSNSESLLAEHDSYQDVITLHPKKLCIVGDPKQSIYRFRGADVAVFLEMQSALRRKDAKGKNVSFSENFRSQKGIVEFSNHFFSFIMSGGKEGYEINFSRDDYQRHQRQLQDEGARVELIKIKRGESGEQKRRIEASAISRRILEIVHPQSPVTIYEKDKNGEEKRKPHPDFCDIAILFRRFTHIKLYERELRKRNIPYYVVKGRGFFGCQEVKDIINFLKYLDGENDDVALVGILRSPMVGISDETLYWLFKGAEKEKRPFTMLSISDQFVKVKSKINIVDIYKIEIFLNLLNQLIDKKDRLSGAELIEKILSLTHYDSIMLTTFQGEQKVANIKKLIELSRAFTRRDTGLLRDFIAYLLRLVEEDAIEPEAQTSLENANVVRLMTIHQAKGLEFPIVFLPDIGHSMRWRSDNIIFDESKGVALKLYQASRGTYKSTMVHQEIKKLLDKKEYAESKRLFYVAVTRARDYLILSGEKPQRKGTECWRVWLDRFLELHPGWVREVEEENISDLSPSEDKSLYQLYQGYQKLEKVKVENSETTEELTRKILQQSCFYKPSPVEEFYITVTALSEYMVCPQRFYYQQYLGLDEGMMSDLKGDGKRFLKGPDRTIHNLSNLEKGSLVHSVLEHINFHFDLDKKKKQIDEVLFNQGFLPENGEVKELKDDIITFLSSDLGITLSRINREHIFKEIPFILRLERNEPPFMVVLQGVIDLLFQDRDGVWTVVDYKYSAGSKIDKEQYKIQLMAYALSVERRVEEDRVRSLIKVIGDREVPLQEWTFMGVELKDFEKKIITATCDIARRQTESTPKIWARSEREDCKHLDCIYKKRCNA